MEIVIGEFLNRAEALVYIEEDIIAYRTYGSPSCHSDWYIVSTKDELRDIIAREEERSEWGYSYVEFAEVLEIY